MCVSVLDCIHTRIRLVSLCLARFCFSTILFLHLLPVTALSFFALFAVFFCFFFFVDFSENIWRLHDVGNSTISN